MGDFQIWNVGWGKVRSFAMEVEACSFFALGMNLEH
jgi:hypothetical protein